MEKTPGSKRERPLSGWEAVLLAAVLLLFAAGVGMGLLIKSKLDKIHYIPPAEAGESAAQTVVEVGEEEPAFDEDELVDISGLEQRQSLLIPEGDAEGDEDVLNILLLGTDEPFNRTDPGRADAIMILSLNFRDSLEQSVK